MTDDVFHRRWMLAEDELLRMLWRCRAGENPDVILLELHARQQGDAPVRPRAVGSRWRVRKGPQRKPGVRR